MATYTIYQMKDEYLHDYGFESYERVKDNLRFDFYKKVYEAQLNGETLEDLYMRFNVNHPKDFTGHSMSVGDIVVFQNPDISVHYCDSFGFESLPTDFIKN